MNPAALPAPAPAVSAIAPKDLVEGLSKGLRLIEAFDEEHPRLTATQAAARCGITRTAARRHLLTLVHLGYASTDGKLFWLAPRVMRLGESFLGAARLPRLVQPFIQQLSQRTGETVNFSVLDAHEVLYLARSNSPRLISVGFHAGARAPAHVVAPGVVLAAAMTDEALATWLNAHAFSRYTSQTVTHHERFVEQIQGCRSRGYWIMEQQLDSGFTGVAMGLTDRRGQCHGAIGMTLQASLWNRDSILERLVPPLVSTVTSLRPVV